MANVNSRVLGYRSFVNRCRSFLVHQPDAAPYLEEHALRLFNTYRACRSTEPKGSLLSVGAGSAFIEGILAEEGVEVSVVDFPEMIAHKKPYYDFAGFRSIPADLAMVDDFARFGQFDVVLASEIIEHLPSAPSEQFTRWSRAISPGGRLIVSTPNLGSIEHILRLLFMRPFLAPPEIAFGAVGIENESAHRREYMPRELASSITQSGLAENGITFTANRRPHSPKSLALAIFQLVPRFRPTMIAQARRP